MKKKQLRFKQIAIGQYRTKEGGLSFVPVGLSTDGQVYKFLMDSGWTTLEDSAAAAQDRTQYDDFDEWPG